ncbi:natriuretic peptides A-like [Synchiropus picturatus]
MRVVVLLGLLVLMCQHTLVSSHILGRPSSTSDLVQLKSLLERFEETLAEAAQQEVDNGDYETNKEQERSQGWSSDQEGNQESRLSSRSQSPDEAQSRALSQKNHLLDLLMTARKRTSGCFGARMDRIGNTSGLGCNSGRGRN